MTDLHEHVGHMHVTSPLGEHLGEGLDIPGTPFGVPHGSSPCNKDGATHSVKVTGQLTRLDVPNLTSLAPWTLPAQRAWGQMCPSLGAQHGTSLWAPRIPLRQA